MRCGGTSTSSPARTAIASSTPSPRRPGKAPADRRRLASVLRRLATTPWGGPADLGPGEVRAALLEAARLLDPSGKADPPTSPPSGMARISIDGAARGNPGPAGIGVILENPVTGARREVCRFLGEVTNNAAEYHALLTALEVARQEGVDRVRITSDSELLVKQVRGEYRVRHPGLQRLHRRVTEALRGFQEIALDHVPREENAAADRLANRAIDEHFKGRGR